MIPGASGSVAASLALSTPPFLLGNLEASRILKLKPRLAVNPVRPRGYTALPLRRSIVPRFFRQYRPRILKMRVLEWKDDFLGIPSLFDYM